MIAVISHIGINTLYPVQVLLDEPNGKPLLFDEISDADDFLHETGLDFDTVTVGFDYIEAEPGDAVDDIIKRFLLSIED